MTIDRIAIWVHPLWSKNDLGETLIDIWRRDIEEFANDKRFGFILTGCHDNFCNSAEWGQKLSPLMGNLPKYFSDRYIRWEENFVEGDNPEHVEIMCRQFGLPDVEFYEIMGQQKPKTKLFREARIDGLIPGRDYCVGHQCRVIKPLTDLFQVYGWKSR